jgi:hypothetical protein
MNELLELQLTILNFIDLAFISVFIFGFLSLVIKLVLEVLGYYDYNNK